MSPKTAPPPPSEAELRAKLGESYAAYEAFLARHADLRPEWKYYGAKLGWSLKLFEKKRNLCFLGAYDGELHIAFVLGARAAEAAQKSKLPAALRKEIREARVYAEGRAARLVVRSEKDLAAADILLEIKRAN